jgi:hypothetical protein
MKKSSISLVLASLAALVAGCSFAARDANMYAKDTQAVLETRSGDIKKCYDEALKTDAKAAGQVTITFTVRVETGNLDELKVDPARSTAPEALSNCVVNSLQGLKLQPADQAEGLATFTWDFQVGAVPTPAPTPAEPAAAATPAK